MNNLKIIISMFIVLLLLVVLLMAHLSNLQQNLVQTSALRSADIYAQTMLQFRDLYTSEVVKPAAKAGIDITHQYAERDNSIPLPVMMSRMLSDRLVDYLSGARATLYSPYPFPWRRQQHLEMKDSFYIAAWQKLNTNPSTPYFEFTGNGEKTTLRYAIADTMSEDCVACHNSHPDSPKSDWKTGDMRGVLTISLPLRDISLQTQTNLKNTALLYIVLGLLVIIAISVVIMKLRHVSESLQNNMNKRTVELETEYTERQRAIEELYETEAQNRLLIEAAGEGIFSLDENGITTMINPAACTMLGYTEDELINQDLHSLIHHTRIDGSPYNRNDCPILNTLLTGKSRRVPDDIFWKKNGTHFPVEYITTPVRKNNSAIGTVTIFNDTSERKEIDRLKDEFISIVSHELRTPLTSIKGSLGIISSGKSGTLPVEINSLVEIAYRNSERLETIINDLLDLQSLKNRHIDIAATLISVNDLCRTATSYNQGYATRYDVGLSFHTHISDSIKIRGDYNRLLQVLSNLLSNAIKYSPQGDDVRIEISPQGNTISIAIHDNGPGIPESFHHRVFEKFAQADSSTTRSKGGTGLGLAISQEIIQHHHGDISFDSSENDGTTFYITLPLADE